MYEHFENMKKSYGDNIYVQIPNSIFKKLSTHIKNKNGSTNVQQSSFAYAYTVVVAILYKYAHFVDIDNETYIQNADIKELLGYSRTTKSIDSVIKKCGILDEIGITKTTKSYPISYFIDSNEKINNIPMREFVTICDIDENFLGYDLIKGIVKNRNYEIKEPVFLFEQDGENGTLYDYSNTHTVTLDEVLKFIKDDNLDNIDFSLYCFLKSKCKGYRNNSNSISLNVITSQLGVGFDALYSHLNKIKEKNYVDVNHKGWRARGDSRLESNVYTFKGIGK